MTRTVMPIRARSAAGAVLFLGLAACSTFGPEPYDNPAYVLDEYGMVYGAVPGSRTGEAYLAPRFSVYDSGLYDPLNDYWHGSFGVSVPGFNPWRGAHHGYPPFYAGGVRAPIPSTSLPTRPPADGQPQPVSPVASPVLAPPLMRLKPESGLARPARPDLPFSVRARPTTRTGIRTRPGSRSSQLPPRRAAPERAAPQPPRAPSRPRVIDP